MYLTNTNTFNQIQVRCDTVVPLTATHFAMTYDGSSSASGVRMFYDGIEQPVTIITDSLTGTTLSTDLLYHGSARQATFEACDLNVFRGWNVELTPAQVLLDYNGDVPDTPILPLNQVIGNEMGDDGTAEGAPFGIDVFSLKDTTGTTDGSRTFNINKAGKIAAI